MGTYSEHSTLNDEKIAILLKIDQVWIEKKREAKLPPNIRSQISKLFDRVTTV